MAHVVHWQSICTNLCMNLSHSNKVIYSTMVLGQTPVCHFPALYPYLLHFISRWCPGMTCYVLAYDLRSPVTFAQRRMIQAYTAFCVSVVSSLLDCWDYSAVAPVVRQSIRSYRIPNPDTWTGTSRMQLRLSSIPTTWRGWPCLEQVMKTSFTPKMNRGHFPARVCSVEHYGLFQSHCPATTEDGHLSWIARSSSFHILDLCSLRGYIVV